MPKENLDEVDHLLQTVLVPAFPPNRSQWRKLEITMEFINKSKNSVRQTRIKNANNYSLLSVPQQSNTMKTERMKEAKHIAFSCDAEIIRKENPKQSKHKQRSKWSRIKNSLHQILYVLYYNKHLYNLMHFRLIPYKFDAELS